MLRELFYGSMINRRKYQQPPSRQDFYVVGFFLRSVSDVEIVIYVDSEGEPSINPGILPLRNWERNKFFSPVRMEGMTSELSPDILPNIRSGERRKSSTP